MNISERKRGDRQRLTRMIARESNAMQRDRLRSVLLVLQGRQTLEVTATVARSRAFVQRVKAGATPRDGVASLRGPQIQGILDREFGKTFSLNGVYQLLKRHGFVCLEPRPRHPQQNPAGAKAFTRRAPPFCESRAGFTASHESSRLVPGRGEVRPAGHTHRGLGDQGIAADRRPSEWPQVDLGIRGRRARHGLVSGRAVP